MSSTNPDARPFLTDTYDGLAVSSATGGAAGAPTVSQRFDAYVAAVRTLDSNHQTVEARAAAIAVRDRFLTDTVSLMAQALYQRLVLLDVARRLDRFQALYQLNTRDLAPGNDYYAGLLMDVVSAARAAIARVEEQL